MKCRAWISAVITLAAIASPATAGAAELTLLISNAVKTVMEDIAPRFEASTGHKLRIAYGSTNPTKARIEKGEAFDLTVLGEAAVDDLIIQGKLYGATRTIVARSGLGVAYLKGSLKPDIGTAEAFKRAMLDAKSIGFLDDGLTGTYLKVLFAKMGIAEQVKAKHKGVRGAEAVAAGQVELGVTQISEILYQKETALAGPLPAEIQNYTNFAAVVGANSKEPVIARDLIRFFRSPEAERLMKANGLEPGP